MSPVRTSIFASLAGLAGAAALAASAPAQAAQIQLSRAQLCDLATLVVIAEPTSTEVAWASEAGGALVTTVWLSASRVIEGRVPPGFHLALPGGEKDGLRHVVEDVPTLALDTPVLLFLVPSPTGFQILGGEQGAVRPTGAELAGGRVCP